MKPAQQLQAMWDQLAGRERLAVSLAAGVVCLALLWWLALAPALLTLRTAPAQHRALDASLEQMRAVQQQVQSMRGQAKLAPDDALRTLELTVRRRLGAAVRFTVVADRATIALEGTAPEVLADLLMQARVNARAVPLEARLTRNAAGTWDGSLVLQLSGR